MPRAKRGFKRRHRMNKVRELASGFKLGLGSQIRRTSEAVDRAHKYAFRDRRVKKRDFRGLWIERISIASNDNDISYNKLIHGLTVSNVKLNRKMLSEIAIHDPHGFTAIVEDVRSKAV